MVFGDDDIPYIVESSGIELIDDNLDAVREFMDFDEPAELEELDGEDLEGLEEAEAEPSASEGKEQKELSPAELNAMALEIEFSPVASSSEEAIPDFVITSPFDSMISEYFEVDTPSRTVPQEELEALELAGRKLAEESAVIPEEIDSLVDLPAVYSPFQSYLDEDPPDLEAADDESPTEEASDLLDADEEAIQTLDGIAYVADAALHGGILDNDRFDPDLKNLVDSVIKR
ncbi:hypothetical protein MASR2M78_23430 [Treponema sp.]